VPAGGRGEVSRLDGTEAASLADVSASCEEIYRRQDLSDLYRLYFQCGVAEIDNEGELGVL